MFDQMGMPVLFAMLISTLAITSIGVFIAVRIVAERTGVSKPAPSPISAVQADVAIEKFPETRELD
ncbi:hypothetical protein [Kribbella sp. NPDC051620]|uniref:hypothetical protein n=1 Tax=Kribbella sp. NPDC051620 TaxID=3364120 RepID=UPI0037B09CFB